MCGETLGASRRGGVGGSPCSVEEEAQRAYRLSGFDVDVVDVPRVHAAVAIDVAHCICRMDFAVVDVHLKVELTVARDAEAVTAQAGIANPDSVELDPRR